MAADTRDTAAEPAPPPRHRSQRSHRLWRLLLLIVAVAGIAQWVLDRDARHPEEPEAARRDGIEPDLLMEGARIRQYEADGSLHYRLNAHRVTYFEAAGRTELTTPDLLLYGRGPAPWRARAAHGTLFRPDGVSHLEETVLLEGGVILEQLLRDGELLRLSTTALTLYPDREYAESQHDVMIESHIGRTSAVGLEGDLQRGLLRLFSAPDRPVRTTLLPEQFK